MNACDVRCAFFGAFQHIHIVVIDLRDEGGEMKNEPIRRSMKNMFDTKL